MAACKRWMTVASRRAGRWRIAAPCPVGDPATLLARLVQAAGGAPVVLGADLPLGLPRAYAVRHAAAPDFPAFLRRLAGRPEFFAVCATLAELSPARPFYPLRGVAGMTRAAHAAALGLDGPEALCRACDRATARRPAGAPLFWTLGANQSGKAAIAAWRDMLVPALNGDAPPLLWPFAGDLLALPVPGRCVVAETYPAEALRQLGLVLGGSKRRQDDRAALAAAFNEVLAAGNARAAPALSHAIATGFGDDAAAEDRFDSLLGLLCVVGVLDGRRPGSVPDDPWLRRWEGWVLGQTDLPRPPPADPRAAGPVAVA